MFNDAESITNAMSRQWNIAIALQLESEKHPTIENLTKVSIAFQGYQALLTSLAVARQMGSS